MIGTAIPTVVHNKLKNLLWSVAGHIIDTILQMNGNTIAGDDASGGDLTFTSTTNATKADIHFGSSAPRMTYKENDNKLTLGNISFNAEDSRAEIGDPGFEAAGIDIDGIVVKTGLRVNDFNDNNPYQIISHRHSLVNAANMLGARSKSDSSSHGSVVDGDTCFQVLGVGWTGSHYDKFGEICISADAGTISSTSSPGKIIFLTVADTTNTLTERMCIKEDGNVGIGATSPQEKLAVAGNIVLPKTAGNGIKIDNTTPTFGWRDLLGDVFAKNQGPTKPTIANYRDNLWDYQFQVGDEEYFKFHIPHDWVPGSDIHLHIHWSHNITLVTGGNVVFDYEASYSKGHDRGAFHASVSGTLTGNASTTQYQQPITEIQLSAISPSGSQIDTDLLEPDGIILLTGGVNANNITVSSGGVPDPFVHYIDVHYQSTNIATKDKVPDFYT